MKIPGRNLPTETTGTAKMRIENMSIDKLLVHNTAGTDVVTKTWGRVRSPRVAMMSGLLVLLATATAAAQPASASAPAVRANTPATAVAIFAGGCFWCMEPPFDKLPGVISTTSGYTGGRIANPTYEQVSAGGTGHAESVQVKYDPRKVSYATLLDTYWHQIDPVAVDRQFCDSGTQYRSAIFTSDPEQARLAADSKRQQQARFKQPIATEVVVATRFYPAETYHQDYYKKNPLRYKFYRYNCGRDQRLQEVWGSSGH